MSIIRQVLLAIYHSILKFFNVETFFHLFIFISITISILYIISLFDKVRKFIYKQNYSVIEKIFLMVIFGVLGSLASEYGFLIAGAPVNVRDCLAIFAGILGGLPVGIGAGVISGLYRMSPLFIRGWMGINGSLKLLTAAGCGIATIGAGLIGGFLSKYKQFDIKSINYKKIWQLVGITFIWEIIHIQLIAPGLATLKPFKVIFIDFGGKVLLPMSFANALGILLLLFITRDIIVKREMEIAELEIVMSELQSKKRK